MVNNDEWLSSLKYLEFLRDMGTYFTINRMLQFESVKQRMSRDAPLSFLEFNYMILQAYDFLELSRRYKVRLQLGGSDQWGNIVSGTELARRVDRSQVFGLTAPLITTSDGRKMGKTEGGAVWLNAEKLSPYEYWQFWRNTADADVTRFLKLFTELPLPEIDELSSLTGSDINSAKEVLADAATSLLHGPGCLPSIHETASSLFASRGSPVFETSGLSRFPLPRSELGTARAASLFQALGLTGSKKEAKRLIQGGGARIGDVKIEDENRCLEEGDFEDGECVLRAGKKKAGVVFLE
jgi:tyrosyl-tRNA synthetase